MNKRILAGLAAVTLLDISASTAEAQSWNGFYVGLHGGYRWSDAHLSTGIYTLDNPVDIDPVIGPRSETYRLDSGIFGLHAGFNVQLPPNWLFGIETDVDFGNGDDEKARIITIDGVAYQLVSRAELSWQATIRGRLGVTSGPWLYYTTAGIAFAEFNWDETFSRTGVFSTSVSQSGVRTGYVVGAGFEWFMTQNLIMRAEYLFEDFGSFSVPLAAALPAGTKGDMDLIAHKVRVGVSFKF